MSGGTNPIVGRPVSSLYSYRWAGLDAQGNPQVYLNGQASSNYPQIVADNNPDDLVYNERTIPPFFGSILNTFNWRGVALSFNIIYKPGHYFRRSSIRYSSFFSGNDAGHTDYYQRWQKPGDENYSNVPSMIYPDDFNRDQVYSYSDILVERAGSMRLNDVRLSYDFDKQRFKKLPVRQLSVFLYGSQLNVVLWKANKLGIDPDYPIQNEYKFGMVGKRLSAGINISF